MQNFFDVIQNRSGVAIQGALVYVYNSLGNLATIYSNNGITTKTNPTASNIDGEYSFYAANGTYNLAIAATGYTSETRAGVVLYDPSESSANLTGPITSVGTATAIASQTGTGTTFVMSESPTVNNLSYSGTLTGGTDVVNLGSGQFYKDAAGNLGLGVTPSAWGGSFKVVETIGGAIGSNTSTESYLFCNNYFDTTFRYKNNSGASYLQQSSGQFRFFNAPSGTAGAAISFTQAMTLDASGNLGIGTSSPNASAILDAQSTTKGVRMPNMTTTQKNAIASPAAGLMVFDTTLAKLCVYTGAAWQTITSV